MISEKLQELYRQYIISHPDEHFVQCGIVNEEIYNSSSPKLVCVLKEVNDPKQNINWCMTGFLREQVKKGLRGENIHPTCKVVGIWSYAIHNNLPKYSAINLNQIAANGLDYIGMTNLKKSGGSGEANNKVVFDYAQKTIDLWRTELEIMDPDIVLCCGTFLMVINLLKLKDYKTETGLHYSVWGHGDCISLLVSIYHPASRLRDDMVYAFLKETLLELREKGFWN